MNNNISKVIIDWKDIKDFEDNYFILNSGETIRCPIWSLNILARKIIIGVVCSINNKLNDKYINTYISRTTENAKRMIIDLVKEQITKNIVEEPKTNNLSELESLEKIMNMYKEGLLTDEEFVAMKQKVIGNSNELEVIFCDVCGAEIIEDSKFCIKCGNKVN